MWSLGVEGGDSSLLWSGSVLAFQQVLAHGLVCFKNKNKSMASRGSGELGNGCDL